MSLTVERLRELLSYDAASGIFRWRVSRGKALAGTIAGHHQASHYWQIEIDRVMYRAHRLAWLYVHGRWPEGELDHINRIRDDNRIDNLRETTRLLNASHTSSVARAKSGFKGVTQCGRTGAWQASISIFGKLKYLGRFETPEAAHEEFVRAADERQKLYRVRAHQNAETKVRAKSASGSVLARQ